MAFKPMGPPSHWGRDSDTRQAQRKQENEERFRLVRIKGMTVLATTDKAILVVETETIGPGMGVGVKQWVPRSQIREASPSLSSWEKDDEVEFSVPRWLADEKEFLYD